MKCQHCGVNFEDTEKVCPMCGAKAGSPGRMSQPKPKWHGKPRETYTDYHPTIENSSSVKPAKSKVRPIKDKPKKKNARVAVIAILIIALIQIVPAIFEFIVDDVLPAFVDEWGPSYTADYSAENDAYDEDSDNTYVYDDDYDTLCDAFGENGITAEEYGNTYLFKASGDGARYEFSYTEQDGSWFRSTGTAWCFAEDDEDYYYREEYPYDEYLMYSVNLTPDHQEASGTRPEWCNFLLQSKEDSIWLSVFRSRTTDEVVVEDMDGVGLFGSSNVMHFNEVTEN